MRKAPLRTGSNRRNESVGFYIAFAIGWLWITALLTAVYVFGRLAWSYIGWGEPLVFGILVIIGFVWTYARFDIDEKHERLRDRIERLEQILWENGIRSRDE